MQRLTFFLATAFCIAVLSASASAQVPLTYYDFENNATRTTFENAVEQQINAGNSTLTKVGLTTTITGATGAGTALHPAAGGTAGTAINATTWSSVTTDPGIAATTYYQFTIDTTGFTTASFSLDEFAGTTSASFPCTGATISTTGVGGPYSSLIAGTCGTNNTWRTKSVALPAAANNNASVVIRVYGYFSDLTAAGVLRLDNITVFATTATTGTKTLLNEAGIFTSVTSGSTGSLFIRTNFTLSGATVTTFASGPAVFAEAFSGTLAVNSGTLTLAGSIFESGAASATTVASGATLSCGTLANTFSGAGSFTLNSGANFHISDANGITTSPTLSGNVQVTGARTYNAGANYFYIRNATGAQVTGNGLPAALTGNLTVTLGASADSPLTLSQSMTESGTLTLTSGTLSIGANTLTQNGAVVNNATLSGGTGTVILSGGTTRTLSGTGAYNLNHLTLSASGGTVNLASNVTLHVAGNFSKTAGSYTCNSTATATANTCTLDFNGGATSTFSWVTISTLPWNITIQTGTTVSLGATNSSFTLRGNLGGGGTLTATGGTITVDTVTNSTISGADTFNNLTVDSPTTVTLNANEIINGTLNVSGGTLDHGASANLISGPITVASGATYQNLGTGDLTLSNNVSNSGTINFNANGAPCGDADSILIRSSVGGTQRTWSGAGTFSMTDVDVQDQRTPVVPPPVSIFVTSGTNSGNNTGWVFLGSCTAGTYVWTGTVSTDWQVPANWSPTRAVPAAGDVLVFDGTATPAPTVTNVPTQNIAALRLTNGVSPTLNASAVAPPQTLTLSGATGTDLAVPSGNLLTISSANALRISVAAGSTGVVGGQIILQGGAHRVIGNAASAVTFQSGALFTTASGFTGNPFGTGAVADGTADSIIFANGSFYFHNAGASPFGVAPNPAVVVFQTGSLATFLTASGFEASGRTYADLAIGKVDPGGVEVDASASGAGNFQFDNLSVNSTGTADSSLTFTGSGANTITIRGRIDSNGVGIGGTLPDVIFTAGSGGILIDNPGNTLVFDTDGNGRGIDFESSATVTTNTELLLNRKLLVGISQPSSFVLTVNGVLNGSATGYVIGNVKRPVTTPETFIYHVGTPNGYSPLDAVFTAGTGDLTVVARQGAQPVLTSATSLQRYWTLTEGGAVTADLTFHYNSPDVMGTEANYRLVIVESGNATSFPENCPNVACVDESANTIRRTGVTTFSDWTAAEPAAPTAVNLTGFSAMRSGDEVKLQWQSGYEARNLGYNIYREQDGKRVQITPALVAGSALVAGNRTRLTAGLSYSWHDQVPGVRGQGTGGSSLQSPVAGQRSAVGGQSSVTYWLEDVDLNGTRTLHGPIAIAECGSGNADCRKLSERSRLLNELTNRHSAITSLQPNDGVQLRSWPAAVTVPDNHDPEPDPVEMQRTIAGMTGLKVSVSRAGWYRITQPEVLAAGLNIADANGLQLYRDGRQVAFRLSNSSEQFGPADYLEFYGEGLNSATATAQTYYLVKLAEPGKRVEVKPQVVSPGDRVSPQGFAYTVERKERMTYFSALLNGDAENFFGQIVSSTPATAAIPVNHLDATTQGAGTAAQLEVVLQGVTNQSHLVQVRINGTDLGTINFANTEHPSQTLSVPAAALLDGNNNVELTSLGGAADVSLVDVLRLTYIRSYVADNNALSFNLESRQTKRITGFTTDHIRLIDVTDPNEPLELTPQVLPDGAGVAALVGVDAEVRAPFSRPHKLLAFVEGQTDAVDALRLNEPSSLWSETAGADYVMISTADLKASIEPLAQLRRNQGMVVQVVDVENLYDEFTFGEHSPRAIHDFLERAMTTWTRQPHYLLLAGDASYDPRNYLGQGLNDLVPTKLIDTTLTETASDDWLADFNGDGIADLASGRLPVRTVAETEALVSKFISYENMAPDPSRGALLVADTSFEGPSSAVQSMLPDGLPVQTINRAAGDDATTHNQIIASLNQGPRVANYYGHGSNGVWTGAGLLSSNDAPALANTNRLSVFTMMTCFNGYFQDAYNDSLTEALLKSQGGAVAVWASTTLTEPAGQNIIGAEFYRLLFGPQPITLGDAARSARIVTTDADVRRTWTLFGDPAMRLR